MGHTSHSPGQRLGGSQWPTEDLASYFREGCPTGFASAVSHTPASHTMSRVIMETFSYSWGKVFNPFSELCIQLSSLFQTLMGILHTQSDQAFCLQHSDIWEPWLGFPISCAKSHSGDRVHVLCSAVISSHHAVREGLSVPHRGGAYHGSSLERVTSSNQNHSLATCHFHCFSRKWNLYYSSVSWPCKRRPCMWADDQTEVTGRDGDMIILMCISTRLMQLIFGKNLRFVTGS